MIHTAGCIVIGDEVLGGKTVDTNSAYMAKFCFDLGLSLKRVEVIGDDEGEIMEATRRMSTHYDFVVTSGGIGPTSVCHDRRFFFWPPPHPDGVRWSMFAHAHRQTR